MRLLILTMPALTASTAGIPIQDATNNVLMISLSFLFYA
jgi:hypothetical protein